MAAGLGRLCTGYRLWRSLPRNIQLVFIFSGFNALAYNIWGSQLLPPYIYLLYGHSDEVVGYVSAVSGACMLLAAIPSGLYADMRARKPVTRGASFVGVVGVAAVMVAILLSKLWLLYLAMAIYGIFNGMSNTGMQAVFADSVPSGKRSTIYANRYALSSIGTCLGPLIAVIFFAVYGDHWKVRALEYVMTGGLVATIIPLIALFLMTEPSGHKRGTKETTKNVGKNTSATDRKAARAPKQVVEAIDEDDLYEQPLHINTSREHGDTDTRLAMPHSLNSGAASSSVTLTMHDQLSSSAVEAVAGRMEAQEEGEAEEMASKQGVLASADTCLMDSDLQNDNGDVQRAMLSRTGSWEEQRETGSVADVEDEEDEKVGEGGGQEEEEEEDFTHITKRTRLIPFVIATSDFFFALGAGMTIRYFPLFFQNEVLLKPIAVNAIYVGAPIVTALFAAIGPRLAKVIGRVQVITVFHVIGTAALYSLGFLKSEAVLIFLYLLRTGIMNASYPVERGLMMDFVRKEKRGIWTAIESLTAFTWTGSSALGGYIVEVSSYRFCFIVTASVYLFAIIVELLLFSLVPPAFNDRTACTRGSRKSDLEEPLLDEEAGEPRS